MDGNLYTIKGTVCRYVDWLTLEKIELCLKEITEKTDMKWWEDENGDYWIHALNFEKHQPGLRLDRRGDDKLPSYEEESESEGYIGNYNGVDLYEAGESKSKVFEDIEIKDKCKTNSNTSPGLTLERSTPEEEGEEEGEGEEEINVAAPSKLQPIHHELTDFLIQRILAREPTNRLCKKNYQSSARRKWPEDFEKMIRLDSRAPPEIREMIEWVTKHTFWAANVLSARKLREKWDALKIQKTNEERSGKNKSTDCKIIEHWDELDNFDPTKPSEISDFFKGHESNFIEHPCTETEQ